jgi:hypothetical protein
MYHRLYPHMIVLLTALLLFGTSPLVVRAFVDSPTEAAYRGARAAAAVVQRSADVEPSRAGSIGAPSTSTRVDSGHAGLGNAAGDSESDNGESARPSSDGATSDRPHAWSEFTHDGITIQAPSSWGMAAGAFGTLFDISIPDEDFFGVLMYSPDMGFPGILALVLIGTHPEIIIQEFDNGAELLSIELLETEQQLPMVKARFSAEFENLAGEGAFYIVSSGQTAYMLIMVAPEERWALFERDIDLVANSITVEPSQIDLVTSTTSDFLYATSTFDFYLAEGWHASGTGDSEVEMALVSPSYNMFGIIMPLPHFEDEEGLDLNGLFDPEDGEPNPEAVEQLSDALLSGVNIATEQFIPALETFELFSHVNAVSFRLMGDVDLNGLMMPATFYWHIRMNGAVAFIFFGDHETTLAEEGNILEMLASVEFF